MSLSFFSVCYYTVFEVHYYSCSCLSWHILCCELDIARFIYTANISDRWRICMKIGAIPFEDI